ncbi:hypothetical protein COLO4_21478 [Corchorus olitorius]|uniref:XS domain-containing protein n=1 Tax=Corchorus olitorius TaxID=93759 RepID=A0A1R3IT05_9ROSI|nr:hypothetical protein COLO4_21478 [Corchorus olitorius]
MHALIMHTYYSDNADLRVDHLGLHKALCVLMGWNYSKPPDSSKTYRFLPAEEAAANQEDLIMWPPVVIIHNTITGKGKDGRMEGLGNKAMDSKLRGETSLIPHVFACLISDCTHCSSESHSVPLWLEYKGDAGLRKYTLLKHLNAGLIVLEFDRKFMLVFDPCCAYNIVCGPSLQALLPIIVHFKPCLSSYAAGLCCKSGFTHFRHVTIKFMVLICGYLFLYLLETMLATGKMLKGTKGFDHEDMPDLFWGRCLEKGCTRECQKSGHWQALFAPQIGPERRFDISTWPDHSNVPFMFFLVGCNVNSGTVLFPIQIQVLDVYLGFGSGKSKAMYGREGHQGITVVKFAGDQLGLKDAVRLAEHFEKENRGRKGWSHVQPMTLGKDDEKNPSLVKVDERTGEKKRIFYGHLGTVADLDKVDFDTRKRVVIESRREHKGPR